MSTQTLAAAFAEHRARLRLGVQLRMDPRLAGRLDASDVVQDAFLEATERFEEYQRDPRMPLFVWLRFLVLQKLAFLHRHHLAVQGRAVGQEVQLQRVADPAASSAALAAQLVGRLSTPSHAAMRAEMQLRLQELLDQMDPGDREILTLRHFEQLTNSEAAKVLGLQESTASMRYARALVRLKDVLLQMPGDWKETGP